MRYESLTGDYGYSVVELGRRVIARNLAQGEADAIAWMLNMVTTPGIRQIEAMIDSGDQMTIDDQVATIFDTEKFDLESR